MKTLAASLTLIGAIACAGVGEKTDTTKILLVNDINARDTTPPPPPPRVSKLTLLDTLPPGGQCGVQRLRGGAVAREIHYVTEVPQRAYVLEIGRTARPFPAMNMDIRGTQVSADLTETENIYVGFTPEGRVSVGVRRYSSTGSTNTNDREPLQFGDSARVMSFARAILDLCDPGR